MNNEMYLIHKDDYLNHIDNQLRLYVMVKQLALNIKRLAPNRGSKKISDMANNYNAIAESLFKSLGIPKSYILFGDEASLAELMENELIAPEDAGYFACEGERCCEMCSCDCDKEDDFELEVPSKEEFAARVLEELTDIVRGVFGENASFHIYVE